MYQISHCGSDMDICLVGDSEDSAAILELWYSELKNRKLGQCILISGARVPVVKLTHQVQEVLSFFSGPFS
jgi:DNA polymerase sigma